MALAHIRIEQGERIRNELDVPVWFYTLWDWREWTERCDSWHADAVLQSELKRHLPWIVLTSLTLSIPDRRAITARRSSFSCSCTSYPSCSRESIIWSSFRFSSWPICYVLHAWRYATIAAESGWMSLRSSLSSSAFWSLHIITYIINHIDIRVTALIECLPPFSSAVLKRLSISFVVLKNSRFSYMLWTNLSRNLLEVKPSIGEFHSFLKRQLNAYSVLPFCTPRMDTAPYFLGKLHWAYCNFLSISCRSSWLSAFQSMYKSGSSWKPKPSFFFSMYCL